MASIHTDWTVEPLILRTDCLELILQACRAGSLTSPTYFVASRFFCGLSLKCMPSQKSYAKHKSQVLNEAGNHNLINIPEAVNRLRQSTFHAAPGL